MNNFKEFLEEGVNDNHLYHGTTWSNLERILSSNKLEGATSQNSTKFHTKYGEHSKKHVDFIYGDGEALYKGVSTSRSYFFALSWGGGAILVLDKRKLQNNYKILPMEFYGPNSRPRGKKEYEEFVIGSIFPLNKYIVGFYVNNDKTKNRLEDLFHRTGNEQYINLIKLKTAWKVYDNI